MKAYPTEFRQKIIDVYENEPISQKQLARQFRVASSFIQKLLKQYRTTGDIAPKVRKEQTPTKLNQEQLAKLAELNEANNDATIAELQDKLEAEIGFRVSSSTVSRMLQKLKITRKKTTYPEVTIQVEGLTEGVGIREKVSSG